MGTFLNKKSSRPLKTVLGLVACPVPVQVLWCQDTGGGNLGPVGGYHPPWKADWPDLAFLLVRIARQSGWQVGASTVHQVDGRGSAFLPHGAANKSRCSRCGLVRSASGPCSQAGVGRTDQPGGCRCLVSAFAQETHGVVDLPRPPADIITGMVPTASTIAGVWKRNSYTQSIHLGARSKGGVLALRPHCAHATSEGLSVLKENRDLPELVPIRDSGTNELGSREVHRLTNTSWSFGPRVRAQQVQSKDARLMNITGVPPI